MSFPNPTSSISSVEYTIRKYSHCSLKAYDITEELIKTLASSSQQPGTYTITWDGRDENGKKAPRGIYFYVLESKEKRAVHKISILY